MSSSNLERLKAEGIKVGHCRYAVLFSDEKVDETEEAFDYSIRAHIDYERSEIVLREWLTPSVIKECLWHEVKHAVLYNAGGLNPSDRRSADSIFARQESGEVGVIQDNPVLVAFLMETA